MSRPGSDATRIRRQPPGSPRTAGWTCGAVPGSASPKRAWSVRDRGSGEAGNQTRAEMSDTDDRLTSTPFCIGGKRGCMASSGVVTISIWGEIHCLRGRRQQPRDLPWRRIGRRRCSTLRVTSAVRSRPYRVLSTDQTGSACPSGKESWSLRNASGTLRMPPPELFDLCDLGSLVLWYPH
jgi:hypothetical protein